MRIFGIEIGVVCHIIKFLYKFEGVMEGEEGETVQFYKIKLMEKEREISNFEAKLKKIEFKHSRDLKESKMAEERASNLLKEEKSKSDKYSKQARENQEQNSLLQLRLAELKEDKDKEVAEVRSQYNKIKEEIRSYQRILPTHTFLQDCGLSIDQLPTYEDIFFNLKDKVSGLEQLNLKFDQYKTKKQEEIATIRQGEELLKQKKQEIETNLQEMLPKILEYEQQISDLKHMIEGLQSEMTELRNELAIQKSQNEQLEEQLKQNDIRLQQISQEFTSEVHNKEEQIKAYYMEEIERYEEEIKSIGSRLQIKDNMYLSQIAILEEDNSLQKQRLQEEHSKHQEQLEYAREEIVQLKDEQQRLRNTIAQITKDNQAKNALINDANRERQDCEERSKALELKIKEILAEHEQNKKEEAISSKKKLKEIEEKCIQLEKANDTLKDELFNLKEEKECLNQEIIQVRNQVQQKKLETVQTLNQLEIPNHAQDYYEKYRRLSGDFNKSNISEEELQSIPLDKEEIGRERARTLSIIRENQQYQKEITSLKITKDDLMQQNSLLKEQLQQAEGNLKASHQEVHRYQDEKKKVQEASEALKREKQKVLAENISLKEKIVVLNKNIYQNEEKVSGSTARFNLQQTKIQSLEKENILLSEQVKREKEVIRPMKQQLKQVKEELAFKTEKYTQEVKELSLTIENLKNQKEKLKNELVSKEKEHKNAVGTLSHTQEAEEKTKSQLSQLQKDFNTLLEKNRQLEKQIHELNKQIQQKEKQIARLQEQNLEKDRQNQLINSSLERERRERTMRTVPSLQSLGGAQQEAEEQTFQDIYAIVTQKEGEINLLQREVSDLKEELESVKIAAAARAQSLQTQQNEYIQTIIDMKMRVAESEMRASEKEHLYNQLKKTVARVTA